MSVHPYVERFREDAWGQELIREGRDQGEAYGRKQGEAHGRKQGEQQGVRQVLLAMIRTRFGPAPEAQAIARTLSTWEAEAAVAAIDAARDPASLLNQIRQ